MAQRYLYPRQRQVEIVMAIYALGLAAYVGIMHSTSDAMPFAWTGASEAEQMAMAYVLAGAAMVHGLGIYINGRWRWSPVLRLAGMAAHSAVVGALAGAGWGSAALVTYGFIAVGLACGAVNAARDTLRAWQGQEPLWKPH